MTDWAGYCADRNRLIAGNQVDLLVDGNETFETMLGAIRGAERFVSIATFIFANDSTGRRFLEALLDARRRGVEVRVVVDGVGSYDTPRNFFRPLVDAGGEVVVYHPVDPWRLKFVLWSRMHRKNLVVDGRVGFCGGLNFHDAPLSAVDGGQGWHDIHARIEGPAVRELHRSFLNTWIRVNGPYRSRHDLLETGKQSGIHPVSVVSAGGKNRGRRRRRIHRAYLHAIRQAERSIHIWNPYFVPPRPIRRALANAAMRGVDVRVIVPERGNFAAVQFAGEHLYHRLLRKGIRIHRWPGPMLHAKTAVIDSIWTTVGSFNLDFQSFFDNLELNLTVFGERFSVATEELFQRDLARSSEIDGRNWEFRPLSDRLLQFVCYFFRRML